MSIAFFTGLDVLKHIHGSLPPPLYIKLDSYQRELEILVTMCFHFAKRGSPIPVTSYSWSFNPHQVSSPMKGSYTGAVSPATASGVCNWTDVRHCSSSAGTGHRSVTDPSQIHHRSIADPSQIHHRPTSLSCHYPHALPEQGKGRQAAQCCLESPGVDTLPGRHSQHWAHTIS